MATNFRGRGLGSVRASWAVEIKGFQKPLTVTQSTCIFIAANRVQAEKSGSVMEARFLLVCWVLAACCCHLQPTSAGDGESDRVNIDAVSDRV